MQAGGRAGSGNEKAAASAAAASTSDKEVPVTSDRLIKAVSVSSSSTALSAS